MTKFMYLPDLHAYVDYEHNFLLDFDFRDLPLGNPALANRIHTTTVILWFFPQKMPFASDLGMLSSNPD